MLRLVFQSCASLSLSSYLETCLLWSDTIFSLTPSMCFLRLVLSNSWCEKVIFRERRCCNYTPATLAKLLLPLVLLHFDVMTGKKICLYRCTLWLRLQLQRLHIVYFIKTAGTNNNTLYLWKKTYIHTYIYESRKNNERWENFLVFLSTNFQCSHNSLHFHSTNVYESFSRV